MKHILAGYAGIEKHVRNLVIAGFFLQFINSSFFLLLNFYMTKAGYEDYMIADLVSYRFLAVMLFAFPLGVFIKGRKLKPFFLVACITVPVVSLLLLHSIEMGWDKMLYVTLALWGIGFTLLQVTSMPYILLNCNPKHHSEAIVLHFLTWSASICIIGLFNFFAQSLFPEIFTDRLLLNLFTLMGFVSVYFILKLDNTENTGNRNKLKNLIGSYDWGKILIVTVPTFIIAVGAGFTIPFVNLFFLNVHGVGSNLFSLMGAFSYFLVAAGVIFMPYVKGRYGYKIAITLIQSFSIIALVIMATTEFFIEYKIALVIAILFFIIRQPLMNVAGPMTSELSLYYVGTRNQEIVSAINASIWSGSWFVSSQIFSVLRESGFRYVEIFYITAILYSIGVIWYYFLIEDYNRKKAKGII